MLYPQLCILTIKISPDLFVLLVTCDVRDAVPVMKLPRSFLGALL